MHPQANTAATLNRLTEPSPVPIRRKQYHKRGAIKP